MAYLVETSILGRMANAMDQFFPTARAAIGKLHGRGEQLFLTAQNLIEFRSIASRPTKVNGLGLSIVEVEAKAAIFEATFPLLPDNPDIFPAWKRLVQAAGVIGKQVHDARLIAVCHVHSIDHVLTFNTSHFTRLASFRPGIMVVDPVTI